MMKMRIVFSLMLVSCLCSFIGCAEDVQNPGIGTSPSVTCDTDGGDCDVGVGIAELEQTLVLPPPCGIWLGLDETAADARSLSGVAPDAEVRTQGFSTCSDAIAIAAQRWPGKSVVRYVVYTVDIRSAQAPQP